MEDKAASRHSTNHNETRENMKADILVLRACVWAAQRAGHPCLAELWVLLKCQEGSWASTCPLSYTLCL